MHALSVHASFMLATCNIFTWIICACIIISHQWKKEAVGGTSLYLYMFYFDWIQAKDARGPCVQWDQDGDQGEGEEEERRWEKEEDHTFDWQHNFQGQSPEREVRWPSMWTPIATSPSLDLQILRASDLGFYFKKIYLFIWKHITQYITNMSPMSKNVRLHGGAGRIPGRQALLLGQVCLIAQLLTDLLRKQYNRLTNASSKLISKYYRLFTLFLDIISMPAVLNCFNR